MATATARRATPSSGEDLAGLLRQAGMERTAVRVIGGGTKLRWALAGGEPELELSTARLDRILEHNAGDLTAVV